jgi:hypothetical protein
MEDDLIIKVAWSWGGSQIIHAHATDALSDVLASHSFSATNGSDLHVALRGCFVDTCFSLQFLQIHTGDHLYCLLKRQPSKEKSRRFLESLTPKPRRSPPAAIADRTDGNKRSQQAKLDDMAYAQWESRVDSRSVLTQILKQREDQTNDTQSDDETYVTELSQEGEISEAPLPHLFQSDGFATAGVLKAGYGWKPGCLKGVSNQSKRGNFFDHLKK